MRNNYDVIVIGAGPAGMMAAITAASKKIQCSGYRTEKTGRK